MLVSISKWLIIMIFFINCIGSTILPEHILLNKLIENYESSTRPILNHNKTLNVYLRLKLTQVLDLSEKDQILTTNMWIEQVN